MALKSRGVGLDVVAAAPPRSAIAAEAGDRRGAPSSVKGSLAPGLAARFSRLAGVALNGRVGCGVKVSVV